MTIRTRTILGWTPVVLISVFLILASALPKLFLSYEGSPLQPFAEALGMWNFMMIIGVLELVCAVLILIPRWSTIGFVLMVGLLGGALATSLTHPDAGTWPWLPLVFLLMLAFSAWYRNPELGSRLFKKPVPKNPMWLRIVGWVASLPIILGNAMTGIVKFLPVEPGSFQDTWARSQGILEIQPVLGVVQLVSLILFIIPRTSVVGFILLTGYWGGVLANNLTHGFQAPAEVMPLLLNVVFLALAAWGRMPELLSRVRKQPVPEKL